MNDIGVTASKLALKLIDMGLDAHAAREMGRVETQIARANFDFFQALAQNRDTAQYVKITQEELYPQYEQIAGEIVNPYVKRQIQPFLEQKKRNGQTASYHACQPECPDIRR